MRPDGKVVIEIYGEGKTDVGQEDATPQPPDKGVITILVATLCGKPARMLVKRYGSPSMMKLLPDTLSADATASWLSRKVRLAKQEARRHGSAAAVFVVDSDGYYTKRRDDLGKGRDSVLPDFPMAVGVAHPCIEAWLLSDAAAIQRGLGLPEAPQVPAEPEKLPGKSREDRGRLKETLTRAVGLQKADLSAKEKNRIAREMNDMNIPRRRCPQGFGPFADEVDRYIRPIF